MKTIVTEIDDLPAVARDRTINWAATVRLGCPHADEARVLFAVMPSQLAVCAACVSRLHPDLREGRCGNCGCVTARDPPRPSWRRSTSPTAPRPASRCARGAQPKEDPMRISGERQVRRQEVERHLMAAAGTGATWAEIEKHTRHRMTTREFTDATRHLIASGALTREGTGSRAVVSRDLQRWIEGLRMSDNERMNVLTKWLAAADERTARERELPKAWCRICGGWARAGAGTRDAALDRTGLVPHPTDPNRRLIPDRIIAPRDADDWRRECATCATATPSDLVAAVTGKRVHDDIAATVIGRMRTIDPDTLQVTVEYPYASAVGHGTGRPWAHVPPDARAAVLATLTEVTTERSIGPAHGEHAGCVASENTATGSKDPSSSDGPTGRPHPCAATATR